MSEPGKDKDLFDLCFEIQDLLKDVPVSTLKDVKTVIPHWIEMLIRKKEKPRSFTIKYNVHRPVVRMVDLLAEDIFPCDFYIMRFYGNRIDLDKIVYTFYFLPSDIGLFRRLCNRKLSAEEREKYAVCMKQMELYILENGTGFLDVPEGIDQTEFINTAATCLTKLLDDWIDTLTISISDFDHGSLKEVWIGIEDGKLKFSLQQKPRYLKLLRDIEPYSDH